MKQILGMFNFYRKFIPNFATLAEPIVELNRGKMKKGSLIKWGQSQDKSLLLLKDRLSKAPELQYLDFAKVFSLEIDTF